MDERRSAIAATAARQHAVFTVAEWIATGLSPRQLQHGVRTGSILRLGPTTFCFPGHPTTFEQRLFAALAEFPEPDAEALSGGCSSARLLKLGTPSSDDVEVSVARPYRFRGRGLPVLVRSHGVLRPVDRVVVDGFASLSAARLIIEEAGRWPVSMLETAVDSSLRLGWTSATFLRARLSALRGPGKRGVRVLDQVLDGVGGHSWLEREFLRLVRSARLTAPQTQVVFRSDGRTVARVDFVWPDQRLVVEVAGHATHASRRDRQRDAQRQTELTALGYRIVTFTYDDVVERPAWLVETLRRLDQRAA